MNCWVKFVSVTFLALFTSSILSQKTASRIYGGNVEFALAAKDVDRYRGEALDGSADAAKKLADFYGMVKLDTDQELYWCQVAAENGSLSAMHDYWVIARLSSNADERRRAVFWLKKAASSGDHQSQVALQDLTDQRTQ